MKKRVDFSAFDFVPVMDYPDNPNERIVFDLSKGYDPAFAGTDKEWGIGRYNEKRMNMYTAPQYGGRRNIHMGIDIWTKAGTPVYSFYEGAVAYQQDNDEEGNYGPTIVTRHRLKDVTLYALYGHLSRRSLEIFKTGEPIAKGQKIGELGEPAVNGGWEPHLHFQLSVKDPGEADMPGVVAEEERETALELYPDPRLVLGRLY